MFPLNASPPDIPLLSLNSLAGLAIKDLSENILLKSLSLPLQLFDN